MEPVGEYRYSESWHSALRQFQLREGQFVEGYYAEMEIIGTHAALRRLWIAEGKRRGYELVNA